MAVILFWTGFEYWNGERGIWLAIAVGLLVYAVYTFFLTWPKDDPPPA